MFALIPAITVGFSVIGELVYSNRNQASEIKEASISTLSDTLPHQVLRYATHLRSLMNIEAMPTGTIGQEQASTIRNILDDIPGSSNLKGNVTVETLRNPQSKHELLKVTRERLLREMAYASENAI